MARPCPARTAAGARLREEADAGRRRQPDAAKVSPSKTRANPTLAQGQICPGGGLQPSGSSRVVDVNVSDTPGAPTVNVVLTDVEKSADDMWRTHTVCPLVTVPLVCQVPVPSQMPLVRMLNCPPLAAMLAAVLIPVIVTMFE